MKKQTKSNLLKSLQSLGIVGLMFFALALACNDDTSSETDSTQPVDRSSSSDKTVNTSGSCSTKAEFLSIFKRDQLKATTTRNDLKQSEIIVTSFNVAASITYSPVYNNKVMKIYPAYPVTVGWTQRTFRFQRITEGDYEGGLFYCYKNPEDYASKFTPEDDRYSKNACVCIAQNTEAVSAAKWRECPYEEGQSDTTCSAN